MKIISIIVPFLMFLACSSNEPSPPEKITEGEKYFPMAEGDTWYFTTSGFTIIKRIISGDTTINGVVCKRVVDEGRTTEAWTLDSEGFKTYLLERIYRFDPPLLIPFNLEKGKPFEYKTIVYFTQGGVPYFADDSGHIEFDGYVTRQVKANTFNNAIKLHYTPANDSAYDEYYAKGIGLLDNGYYFLDSALIGGVWYGRDSI